MSGKAIPMGKARDASAPWLTITDARSGWTWKVLKAYVGNPDEQYARWFCATTSPYVEDELGDGYIAEIKGKIVQRDPEVPDSALPAHLQPPKGRVAVYARAKGARTFVLLGEGNPEVAFDLWRQSLRAYGDVEQVPVEEVAALPATIPSAQLERFKTQNVEAAMLRPVVGQVVGELLDALAKDPSPHPYLKREFGADELMALAVSRTLRAAAPTVSAMTMSKFELFAGKYATFEVILHPKVAYS